MSGTKVFVGLFQKYFYMICFTGYLRDQAKLCMDAASEEDKKAFALTGGKRKSFSGVGEEFGGQ